MGEISYSLMCDTIVNKSTIFHATPARFDHSARNTNPCFAARTTGTVKMRREKMVRCNMDNTHT